MRQGTRKKWESTIKGAQKTLEKLFKTIPKYSELRDCPGIQGTSNLLPYLRFGQICPNQIKVKLSGKLNNKAFGVATYYSQIIWRKFLIITSWCIFLTLWTMAS